MKTPLNARFRTPIIRENGLAGPRPSKLYPTENPPIWPGSISPSPASPLLSPTAGSQSFYPALQVKGLD